MEIKIEVPGIKIGINTTNIWPLETYFPVLFISWGEVRGGMTVLIRFPLNLILLKILIMPSNTVLVSLKLGFSRETM